uniref:helix-turn-helix domain-containing protein n=1 Tax=Amycolatopsis sp. CA-151526 TaxID=3239921 RepID=UPI003F495426
MTHDPSPADAAPAPAFARKLSHLIATIHPPDRDRYSYRELAAGIKESTGMSVSAMHLNQLANGKKANPSLQLVQALATFFGVPLTYFADDQVTAEIDAQLAQLARWRDTEARELAERIMTLNPRDRGTVGALVDSLEQYEAEPRSTRQRRKPRSPEA